MTLAHRLDGPEAAPVLVLASSLGTSWELWDAQLPELAVGFRILRYDHPGHGRSAPPEGPVTVESLARGVVDLLDGLELERASFCGISLGGVVGMALARDHPDRIERLALCFTAAWFGPAEQWHERARIVREAGTAAVAERALSRWFTDRFRAEHPQTVARFRRILEDTSREGYAACCEAIAAWDARAAGALEAIRAPTLVVAGSEDVAVPPADAEALAASIPGARLALLADAAHLGNVERPEEFTRALLAHLSPTSAEEAA
jgi:3-oxoadipate enol-lactonase